MIYYRRYVGDYQRKTMRLDPTDHGVYDLMLDYCYAEEMPLPLELDDIHAICKAIKPEHRKSVAKVLRLYFVRRDDGYHNTRADEEIAISRQARVNGRGGGRPRKTENETGTVTEEVTGDETGSVTGTITETLTGNISGSVHPSTTNHLAVQPSAFQPSSLQPPTKAKPRGARSRSNGEEKFELPDWVPAAQWDAWIEARTKKRNAPTEWAKELAVAKLEELREQGHHPAQVLAQSAFQGWSGLFPVKA